MDDETYRGWSRVARDFYYDATSRVPAGGFVILAIGWVVCRHGQRDLPALEDLALASWAFIAALFTLFVIGSLATGLLLTGLGDFIARWFRVWIVEKVCSAYEEADNEQLVKVVKNLKETAVDSVAFYRAERSIHERLKASDPYALKLLPRMRSEAALANNTIAATVVVILVALVYGYSTLGSLSGLRTEIALLILGALLATVASLYRTRAYLQTELALLEEFYSSPKEEETRPVDTESA